MKIASWNVNSIRARLPNVLEWVDKAMPDVLLLQELKALEEQFPAIEFEERGYHYAIAGQKSWNGVALLSKHPISDLNTSLPLLEGDEEDLQSRYIEAKIQGFQIACLYLPNGNPVDTEKYPYKLGWMDRLIAHTKQHLEQDTPLILGGDFNIIPEPQDCVSTSDWENDALYKVESRQKYRTLLNLGLTDAFRALSPNSESYSFWDYQAGSWQRNNGIRIDHFLLSPEATDRLQECVIDKEPRGKEKASDHTPIIVTLKDNK